MGLAAWRGALDGDHHRDLIDPPTFRTIVLLSVPECDGGRRDHMGNGADHRSFCMYW
jgi:hypothetical protein